MPLPRGGAAVARGFGDEASLIEQLVALEHLLLVEAAADAEAHFQPLGAAQRTRWLVRRRRALGPFLQPRLDLARENFRLAVPPVLPGEIGVPGRPMRAEQLLARAAGQSEITDGENVRCRVAGLGVPPAVAESVKLLDITEVEAGLPLHPGAKADLERAVLARGERAEGQRVPFARADFARTHDEDMRLLIADADDRGVKPKLDLCAADRLRGAKGLGHGIRPRRGRTARRPALPRQTRRGRCPRPRRSCDRSARAPHRREPPAAGWDRRWRTHGAALCARPNSSASGLSAQSVMKAAAVERLMPAQQ